MKQGPIDMKGYKYNGCEVLNRAGSNKYGRAIWAVKCHCGNIFYPEGASIRNNESNSCGCSRNETRKKMGEDNKTHGETKTRLYATWQNMKKRCHKKSHKSYSYYGGRGIKVCDEWYNSFEKFREWSINNGYDDNLTIDRIDVNGNYEPKNCRWSTLLEQGSNRRNNTLILYNGEILTQAEVCRRTGLSKYMVKKYFTIVKESQDTEYPEDKLKSNKETPEEKEADLKETPEDSLQSKNKETRNPNKYMD